jgi:hypothetical protein
MSENSAQHREKDVPEDRPFSISLLVEVHEVKNGLENYLDLSHQIETVLVRKEEAIDEATTTAFDAVPEDRHDDIAQDYAWEVRHP